MTKSRTYHRVMYCGMFKRCNMLNNEIKSYKLVLGRNYDCKKIKSLASGVVEIEGMRGNSRMGFCRGVYPSHLLVLRHGNGDQHRCSKYCEARYHKNHVHVMRRKGSLGSFWPTYADSPRSVNGKFLTAISSSKKAKGLPWMKSWFRTILSMSRFKDDSILPDLMQTSLEIDSDSKQLDELDFTCVS